jgi:hypothetical protein
MAGVLAETAAAEVLLAVFMGSILPVAQSRPSGMPAVDRPRMG